MNRLHFHGIVRILFALTLLLPAIVFSSCSSDDDDEQSHLYSIGIESMSVSGDMSYLSALLEAERQFESSFTLTGSQKTCDGQAKANFVTAMTIIRNSATNVNDCEGYVIYVLTRMGEKLASEQIDFVISPQ